MVVGFWCADWLALFQVVIAYASRNTGIAWTVEDLTLVGQDVAMEVCSYNVPYMCNW